MLKNLKKIYFQNLRFLVKKKKPPESGWLYYDIETHY